MIFVVDNIRRAMAYHMAVYKAFYWEFNNTLSLLKVPYYVPYKLPFDIL